jgi:phosphoadenosine phosphosulfate reductase
MEWDESNQIIKFHPLLHWTWGQVKQFVSRNDVPYNPLHDKGFVSIGCAPCTRAIKPGEDFRAGRWWWEDNSKKECGLHVHTEAEETSNIEK